MALCIPGVQELPTKLCILGPCHTWKGAYVIFSSKTYAF